MRHGNVIVRPYYLIHHRRIYMATVCTIVDIRKEEAVGCFKITRESRKFLNNQSFTTSSASSTSVLQVT